MGIQTSDGDSITFLAAELAPSAKRRYVLFGFSSAAAAAGPALMGAFAPIFVAGAANAADTFGWAGFGADAAVAAGGLPTPLGLPELAIKCTSNFS